MTDPKLSQISRDGNLVGKIDAILLGLQKHGYPDAYIAEAMRTRAEQAEKVRLGYSKTMASYHLKRGSDGKGLAADIVPKSTGWNAPKRYWMMLGHLCRSYGRGTDDPDRCDYIATAGTLSANKGGAERPAGNAKELDFCVPIAFDTCDSENSRFDGATNPLRAGAIEGVQVGWRVRRLTPRECERLMGLPDDFTRYSVDGKEIADGPRYRMLGNGWSVPQAEWMARRILEHGL